MIIDMLGKKCNRLTVIKRAKNGNGGEVRWMCLCECGQTSIVRGAYLRSGLAVSCGCYKRQKASETCKKRNTKHNMSKTRIYTVWAGIKTRCDNPNQLQFKDYGGRGIKLCHRWRSFELFFKDMGLPPTDKHQIDRIDNNGNYEPKNCRWVLPKYNVRNGRSAKLNETKVEEIRKKYSDGISQYALAEIYGVSRSAINHITSGRNWR